MPLHNQDVAWHGTFTSEGQALHSELMPGGPARFPTWLRAPRKPVLMDVGCCWGMRPIKHTQGCSEWDLDRDMAWTLNELSWFTADTTSTPMRRFCM